MESYPGRAVEFAVPGSVTLHLTDFAVLVIGRSATGAGGMVPRVAIPAYRVTRRKGVGGEDTGAGVWTGDLIRDVHIAFDFLLGVRGGVGGG